MEECINKAIMRHIYLLPSDIILMIIQKCQADGCNDRRTLTSLLVSCKLIHRVVAANFKAPYVPRYN